MQQKSYEDARIIAHIDLDCFYVQVERRWNPKLKSLPVGVVQYNPFGDLKTLLPTDNRTVSNGSLIAVSYEARAKGVKRSMRGAEAKKACAELILIQVPTSHGKADLTIYRDASAQIIAVLAKRYSSIIIERASIDEVYLDLSKESEKLLQNSTDEMLKSYIAFLPQSTRIAGEDNVEIKMSKNQISKGHSGTTMENLNQQTSSNNWFERSLHNWTTEEKLLLCGSIVISNLRKDVLDELGFTCSAGIAHNKMLAKIASSMHKPNKQTVVPQSIVESIMSELPFSRVQGFGGKLGQALSEYWSVDNLKTLGDIIEKVDKHELIAKFGEETTQWILNTARGIDLEPVQNRLLPKSIGCSKTYRSSNMLTRDNLNDGTVLHWLTELSSELHDRLTSDSKLNDRIAKQLHVSFSVLFKSTDNNNNSNSNNNSSNDNNNLKKIVDVCDEENKEKDTSPTRKKIKTENSGLDNTNQNNNSSNKNTNIDNRGNTNSNLNNIKINNRGNNNIVIELSKTGTMVHGGVESIAKHALAMMHRALSESLKVSSYGGKEWFITCIGLFMFYILFSYLFMYVCKYVCTVYLSNYYCLLL
jgi:DNA polymerase eta